MITAIIHFIRIYAGKFVKNERGVTAVEYAIIGVALSAVVIAIFDKDLQVFLEEAITSISEGGAVSYCE